VSIRRAVIFSSLERYYGFVVAFVTTIVISRLLTPAEVGAFSVAMSMAGVASGLREFGASSFLIRTANLEKHHESCAFGLTLLLGGSLGLLLLLLAGPIATFFGQSNVATLLRILSLNFFLLPFGTVNSALIQRAMRFDVMARINIIAITLSFVVSVGLAWQGFGAYSLAWGAVTLSAATACLSLVWGPGAIFVRPRLRGAGELVRFGAQTTGLSLLWEVSARFPDFILGKMQSFAAAGLMSRAMGLVGNVNDLLLKGLYSVALSHFSQIQRDKGDPVQAHLRIATLVTGLGWPAFVGLAFFAEPITIALYGEQWLGIIWPLRIVCLQLALGLPFCFQFQVIMAKGGMDQQVKASILAVAFKLACLAVVSAWGVNAVAIGLVVSQIVQTILASVLVWPEINVRWKDYWSVIRANISPLLTAVVACGAAMFLGAYFKLSTLQVLLILGPASGLSVVAGYLLARHPLVEEGRKLIRSRRSA
jgi:O-antigen/teichoic acid export membrane protein